MIDVLAIGEILMDLVATTENVTLFDAPAFQPKPGGAPANVAVGVARLGKASAFVGKLGRDGFGQGFRALLERAGVITTGLLEDPDALTTLAIVALSTGGDPHFAFAPGAHTRLTPAELPLELLRDARIVCAGSVSLAHQPVGDATLAALQVAHAAGAIVAFDVNWRPFLFRDRPLAAALAIVRQPLALADIIKLNQGELRLLTDTDDLAEGLARLAATTPATLIVVTLGARGSAVWWRDQLLTMPAPVVQTVVDATGAGDAFLAALLASLPTRLADLDEPGLRASMRRAVAAGAIAVTVRGAIPALPTTDALEAYLAAQAG